MRLRLIWVGKTRDARLRGLAEEYLKRLGRFARFEVVEVREGGSPDERVCLEEEGKRIGAALASDALTVLLDVGGSQWSSEELASQVEAWQGRSVKEVAFVVGGHLGVSREVRARADHRWSLSRLTLTHEMARVLLCEQLYRAYTILRGVPYQK